MSGVAHSNGSLDRYDAALCQDARFLGHVLRDNLREARIRTVGHIDVREHNDQVCLLLPYANGDRIFDRLHREVNYTDSYGKRTGLANALSELFGYKPSPELRAHMRLAPNPVWVNPVDGKSYVTVRPYPSNQEQDVLIENGVLPEGVDLKTLPLRVVEAEEGKPRLALAFNKQEGSEQAQAFGSLLAEKLEKELGITGPARGAAAGR